VGHLDRTSFNDDRKGVREDGSKFMETHPDLGGGEMIGTQSQSRGKKRGK